MRLRIRSTNSIFLRIGVLAGVAAGAVLMSATAIWSQETGEKEVIVVEGAALPAAVRVDSFLGHLARFHALDQEHGTQRVQNILRNQVGLEPSSDAARELVDLAVELEENHPEVSQEHLRQAKEGKGLDLTRKGGWIHQRYAKIGKAMGIWLRDREAEGWAIEPLLQRILESSGGIALYSDEPDFLPRLEARCRAFQATLASTLGRLPRTFEQQ